MSIRARLQIAILSLVITTVIALSLLNLHSTVDENLRDAEERSVLLSQMVKNYVLERITELAEDRLPREPDIEQSKQVWYEIVRRDQVLARILEKTMTVSSVVVEIIITDESGTILTGSNRNRVGTVSRDIQAFTEWQNRPMWEKLWQVLRTNQDFAISVPLGVYGRQVPILTVKALVSSVLLRRAIDVQLKQFALASIGALAIAVFLAVVVSNLVSRSLQRIGKHIEDISRGYIAGVQAESFESKELADVQVKLAELGKRFQGAREDALSLRTNIDQMLQRLEEAVLLFDKFGKLQMAGLPSERLFSKKRDELLGRTFDEIFPSWTTLGVAVAGAIREQKELRDVPVSMERANMPAARLLLSVEPVGQNESRRLGTLITLKDAETRRQLESQLDISSRLAAIGRVTSGVAHEIKNPLNAITLHLEVARNLVDSDPAELQKEIEIISAEVSRLDRVVKTFLDFTRPLDVQLGDCDLSKLVEDVTSLLNREAEQRAIAIRYEALEDHAIVRGDADLIRQAILNVVLNGLEAMPASGSLEVKVYKSFNDYIVSIQDHGTGIPPEIQDKIFNLYFTTKPSGSGIGLAVTFRVVQLHNGTITFDSEPGKGTCFRLAFPERQAKQQEERSSA